MIMVFIFLFIFGLFLGSFLNVVIDRVPRDETFLTGRSHCDFCHHVLSFEDLIPVVSYISLGGKCRYCHKKLGMKYPLVELTTGLLLAVSAVLLINQSPFTLILSLITVCFLIIIFFTDLWYGIIPDGTVIGLGLVGIALCFLFPATIIPRVISSIVAGSFFLALFLATKGKGMGFGDVKLAFSLGLLLSFPAVVVAFYVAFLTGAIGALILVLWRKKKLRGGTISFGPFLVFATLVSLFWGGELWRLVIRVLLHM